MSLDTRVDSAIKGTNAIRRQWRGHSTTFGLLRPNVEANTAKSLHAPKQTP